MAQKENEAEMAQNSIDFLDGIINGSEETNSISLPDEAINHTQPSTESDESDESVDITESNDSSIVDLILDKIVEVPEEIIAVKAAFDEAEDKVNDTTEKSNEAEDKNTPDQQKIPLSDSSEAKENKKFSEKNSESLGSEKDNINESENKSDNKKIEPAEKNNNEETLNEEQPKPIEEPVIKKVTPNQRNRIAEMNKKRENAKKNSENNLITQVASQKTETEYLDDNPSVAAKIAHDEKYTGISPRPVVVHKENTVTTAQITVQEVKKIHEKRINNEDYVAGSKFLQFLTTGLSDGTLEYNSPKASIHFVPEGMVLMTPKIFSLYTGVTFSKFNQNCPSVAAQKAFERLNIHKVNKKRTGKTSHWHFSATNSDSDKSKLIHAYLIPNENLHRIFMNNMERPTNNPNIKMISIF